jgi:hypothetical protein
MNSEVKSPIEALTHRGGEGEGGFRRACRFDGGRDTESGSLFASRRAARLQRQSVNITAVDAILKNGWFVSPGLKGMAFGESVLHS